MTVWCRGVILNTFIQIVCNKYQVPGSMLDKRAHTLQENIILQNCCDEVNLRHNCGDIRNIS